VEIGMSLDPHDHRMWMVSGIYSGQENNSLSHSSESDLIVQGGKTLASKYDPFGDAIIHRLRIGLIKSQLHLDSI
jgi:hypothetical protein